MFKLNAFQLKIIALVMMLLDHLYFSFLDLFPVWIHPLSRFVAPLFAYLMVEGFFHTRNRLSYNVRLLGFAVFMQIGNMIINGAFASEQVRINNNIFMTLAAGLIVISLFELSKTRAGLSKIALVAGALLIIPAGIIFTEGGIVGIPFILITYFFRKSMKAKMIGYGLLSVGLFLTSYVPYETVSETILMLMVNSDFLFITVIPFILLYNGQRGLSNKFSKYLFYVFYPMHLWILKTVEFIW
ncbi:TraX family protein [Paenibacillus sp. NPDC058174]|uniref:TraX family protein n=1 Tax=Paenibacillus sp. NPDC058174 TaxID=3346366 RepID=UPI0036DF0AF0